MAPNASASASANIGHAAASAANLSDLEFKEVIDAAAAQNPYLSACLKKLKEGRQFFFIPVDRVNSQLCRREEGIVNNLSGKYSLSFRENQLNLDIKIYFIWKGDSEKRQEAFSVLEKSFPEIKFFFARHGIKLNLKTYEQTGLRNRFSADHTVNLHNKIIAQKNNWPLSAHGAYKMSERMRYGIHTHEILHLMGLFDAYYSYDESDNLICPDRRRTELDEIMNNSDRLDITYLYLAQDSIQYLLQPLCEVETFQ